MTTVHCVQRAARFSLGVHYPDPLMVKDYKVEIEDELAARLVLDFPQYFRSKPWPVHEREATDYVEGPSEDIPFPVGTPVVEDEE